MEGDRFAYGAVVCRLTGSPSSDGANALLLYTALCSQWWLLDGEMAASRERARLGVTGPGQALTVTSASK